MQINNLIFIKDDFEIMEITNSEDENPLNWSINSISEKIVPDEGHFLVRSKEILKDRLKTCWMDISTPEMMSDYVFTIDAQNSKIVLNEYCSFAGKVIPDKVSNVLAKYEFYYTKNKPEIGIELLKKEIENTSKKGLICEYLGYIYRDEKEFDKALEWFLRVLNYGEPSSDYIYNEIANIFDEKNETELANKYRKFIN